MANTLALDVDSWDLGVDDNGNIAMLTGAAAIAQDVASACRLFSGELWYDTTQGIPYFQNILGQMPPLAILKAYFIAAAMTVPGVTGAKCFISNISSSSRIVTGQVQATVSATASGTGTTTTVVVNFTTHIPGGV